MIALVPEVIKLTFILVSDNLSKLSKNQNSGESK